MEPKGYSHITLGAIIDKAFPAKDSHLALVKLRVLQLLPMKEQAL